LTFNQSQPKFHVNFNVNLGLEMSSGTQDGRSESGAFTNGQMTSVKTEGDSEPEGFYEYYSLDPSFRDHITESGLRDTVSLKELERGREAIKFET